MRRWRPSGTWFSLLTEFIDGVRRHQLSMLAKQAAYSILYAVPSLVIFVVSLLAIVDEYTGSGLSVVLEQVVVDRAPEELQALLTNLIEHGIAQTSASTAALTALVSMLIAIWGGASGTGALFYACNLAYDVVDTRPFAVKKFQTLALTVFGGVMVVMAFILFAFGQRLGAWLTDEFGSDSVLARLGTSGLGWSLALVLCSLMLLYGLAPDVPHSVRWLLPGTIGATLAAHIVFAGFDFVLSVTNPASAFGSAGGALAFLWLLYLMSLIVVVGAEVNAALARRFDRTLADFLDRHPEKRLDRREDEDRNTPLGE